METEKGMHMKTNKRTPVNTYKNAHTDKYIAMHKTEIRIKINHSKYIYTPKLSLNSAIL